MHGFVVQCTGSWCSGRVCGAVHGFVVQWTGLWCGEYDTKVLFMFFCRCYIPCDAKCSANKSISREPTAILWKAKTSGVSLCYSYENCGSKDDFTKIVEDCVGEGEGWISNTTTLECNKPITAVNIHYSDYSALSTVLGTVAGIAVGVVAVLTVWTVVKRYTR